MIRKSIFALAVAMAVLVSPVASAFEFLWGCNSSYPFYASSVTWEPSLVSFPQGTGWYNSIEAARVAWNTHTPGGAYRITYSWDPAMTISSGDNRNSMAFATPPNGFPFDDISTTILRTQNACATMPWRAEADIFFNPNKSWEFSTNPAAPERLSPPYNLTLAALHEHGHGMGLAHESDILATMNFSYPFGGPIGTRNDVHPHADDANGDRVRFRPTGSVNDLAALAYRLTPGVSGVSQPIPAPGAAHRNSTLSFQVTVENRGTNSLSSVPIRFYLSPTRNVTTSSFLLGSGVLTVEGGLVRTVTVNVTVPVNAPSGPQYIGWIIDPFNTISETDEGNNGVTHTNATLILDNSPPNACFTADPSYGPSPLYVTLNGSCSTDPDGDALTYTWDFGDGTGTATGMQVNHWYSFDGTYIVTLTVRDPAGASAVTSQTITAFCDPSSGQYCPE